MACIDNGKVIMIPEIRISSVEYVIQLTGLSDVNLEVLEERLMSFDWVTMASVDNDKLYIEVTISSGRIDEVTEVKEYLDRFFQG